MKSADGPHVLPVAHAAGGVSGVCVRLIQLRDHEGGAPCRGPGLRSSARGGRGSPGRGMRTPCLQDPVIDFLKNDISI